MNIVQVLPPSLSDQIAAGEVLERPSAAVKELIENALDASSTRIEIDLKGSGRECIRIRDNGCGMTPDDAKTSILRHATSKIRTTEDLSRITSLGFRGEALASMAAVSKMKLETRKASEISGVSLRIEGSVIVEEREIATTPGTSIEIADLFFNTPARLKFLKTDNTEYRKIHEAVESFAIAYPGVHFILRRDGKEKLNLPPTTNPKDRILGVLGREVYERCYAIKDFRGSYVRISGFFAEPSTEANKNARQFLYINNRAVRDRTLIAALTSAFKDVNTGKLPFILLQIEMPPENVDVNVHPTKAEVRFKDQDLVFRCVYRALRDSLAFTPWLDSKETGEASIDTLPQAGGSTIFEPPEQTNAYYSVPESRISALSKTYGESQNAYASFPRGYEELAASIVSLPGTPETANEIMPSETDERTCLSSGENAELFAKNTIGYFSSLRFLGQLGLTYLICADPDENLVIVDQHAAHERINYQKLKDLWEKRTKHASQTLLFPILAEFDGLMSAVMEESLDFFRDLGFDIDPFGERVFAVKAVPEFLIGAQYVTMIRDALEEIRKYRRSEVFVEHVDHILSTMACHQSIRAGMLIDGRAATELFKTMDRTLFCSNCPHGRPVHFALSKTELEKRFLR